MAKLKELDYLAAIEIILNDCLFSVNPCDIYEDYQIPLHSHIPSPETLVIKKQAYERLSDEAKEIITTVCYSTGEIYDMISTPKTGVLTKKSIRKYFRRVWQSKFITEHTLREITTWANQL